MDQTKIRNFCVISHIDHGKSTLADRFLELTKTQQPQKIREQTLDSMDLERERGITIKLHPVRMKWKGYILNLIDTPGHIDFTYEVSRSLRACEGAILLVDATQGIQAQTLANYNLALEQNLKIIPLINKIDLPNAQIQKVKKDLAQLLNINPNEILEASAKKGVGIKEILERVVKLVPAPKGDPQKPSRVLIFDSFYDLYLGVIAIVRIVDGYYLEGDKIKILGTDATAEAVELGCFKPHRDKRAALQTGEVGYIATGLKDVKFCRAGDTITKLKVKSEKLKVNPLPGYKEVKSMIFSQIFCLDNNDYRKLKDALGKLKLNDAAFCFEPISSSALGFGFRCGFLGLLHMDIIKERLSWEFDLDIILTHPNVNYKVHLKDGDVRFINSPSFFPDPNQIDYIEEPYVVMDIITPKQYLGAVMKLAQNRKGEYQNQEYLTPEQVILTYKIPLSQIIINFYDRLKSITSGFASLNYKLAGFSKTEIVRLDILIADEKVEALSRLVYPDTAYKIGRELVKRLKEIIPRQMFEIPIQAALGSKIIARETIKAYRKDVTAKLYGGDRTRKDKLLKKQKRGKRKMKKIGKIELPSEAFWAVLEQK